MQSQCTLNAVVAPCALGSRSSKPVFASAKLDTASGTSGFTGESPLVSRQLASMFVSGQRFFLIGFARDIYERWSAWRRMVRIHKLRKLTICELSELTDDVLQDIGVPESLLLEAHAARQRKHHRHSSWLWS